MALLMSQSVSPGNVGLGLIGVWGAAQCLASRAAACEYSNVFAKVLEETEDITEASKECKDHENAHLLLRFPVTRLLGSAQRHTILGQLMYVQQMDRLKRRN